MKSSLFSLLAVFLLASCTPQGAQNANVVQLISPSGETLSVSVEIAASEEEQEKGLMGRTELADGKGMLFVFDHAQSLSFWMKNTLIPLDILYFDDDQKLVSTAQMTPCTEDPCETYPSAGAARYALEVPFDYAIRHGIGPGWRMEWVR